MATSKLKSILDTFSNEDITHIHKCFQSHPLKLSSDELLTWSEIKKNKNKEIDRKVIRKKLFNDRISDARLRNILTEIFKKLEQWVVMNHALNDSQYNEKTLLNYYRNKNSNKLFLSTIRKSNDQESELYGPVESIHHRYDILAESYNYQSSISRTGNLNLQELLDTIDIEFCAKKLRQSCFAQSHAIVTGISYNMGTLELLLKYIESKNLSKYPAIGLYLSAFNMLQTPEEAQHFDLFKSKLEESLNHFPDHEIRSLYLLAINYCVKRINQGELNYGEEILSLYNTSIEGKYLLLDGYLSRYTYGNVITIALKLKKHEWAKSFAEKYKAELKNDEKESTYNFNLANIYYFQRDLDSALSSIQFVDFSDLLFSLKAKTLQAKIYYETESLKSLYSHLDAMQMYLLRKKVIGYHKNNYKNFIKYTKLLVKCNKHVKSEKAGLLEKISTEEILTDRKWFTQQLS